MKTFRHTFQTAQFEQSKTVEQILTRGNIMLHWNGHFYYFWCNQLGKFQQNDISVQCKIDGKRLFSSRMASCWKSLSLSWWRHQLGTFSVSLALCAGNSSNTGEFPSQMPVARSCDVLFDLRQNIRYSKQSRYRWFETLSRSLWCHCNVNVMIRNICCGQQLPPTRNVHL